MGRCRESLLLLRGLFQRKHDPGAFYDLLGSHNNLCEQSLYNNFGYWETARTYDEAGEAMAALVADRLQLDANARILDAGCGFADQDMFWIRRHGYREIQAVNISPSQVARAGERVAAAGLAGRVKLVLASATALPFPDASFDGVVSVEAALHFDTRDRFFREAARVLRPGGRLVVADSASMTPVATWPLPVRLMARVMWHWMQIPAGNIYPADEYGRRLQTAGFRNVAITSIRDQVYPGYSACILRNLAKPEIRHRVNPILRLMWRAMARSEAAHRNDNLDYIVAAATR